MLIVRAGVVWRETWTVKGQGDRGQQRGSLESLGQMKIPAEPINLERRLK